MSLTKDEVRQVAELARLTLTEEEVDLFGRQLSDILDYAEKLNELDTTDVAPTSHARPLQNVLREDSVRPSWPREQVLANASDTQDGQIKVPVVFEDE